MVGMYFHPGPVTNYAQVQQADTRLFQRYFRGMLEAGIYLAPSAFEAGFISTAHTKEIIDQTTAAAAKVLEAVA